MFKHFVLTQGEGKTHFHPEASHRANDAGNKESHLVKQVGGRGIRLYGKERLSGEWTGQQHYGSVCVFVWE